MAQAINSRTVGAQTEKRAVITNGQLMRKMQILTSWTSIRIGLQISFAGSANAVGTPLLFFGLTSGNAEGTGFLDGSNTIHSLGMRGGVGSTFNYSAGPPAYYETGAGIGIVKKVGATITSAAFGSGFTVFMSSAPTTARTGLILQITKGSPNYTLDFAGPQSGTPAQVDCTDALFTSLMEMSVMSGCTGIITGYDDWTPGTVAVDEGANGVLDTLCIAWDKSVPPFEISQAAYRKLA